MESKYAKNIQVFFLLLILVSFSSRLEFKRKKTSYLNVSRSFLQKSVLIVQYADG